MSKKLVFASNNPNKLLEIKNVLPHLHIVSLEEIGCTDEIEEYGKTLAENASIKSNYIFKKFGVDCFADDTGLEIEALNNAPGVHSARYAGNTEANIEKVLNNLRGIENRKAQFRTVISLILNGKEYFFEGKVQGFIAHEKQGNKGFGYDPIFIPNESILGKDENSKSFAQMSMEEKNAISHRARAISQLVAFLKQH